MGTISVPRRTLCPTVEVANGDFFCFLTERDWGQKSCYGNSTKGVILFLFLMFIYGAKFQEHCFNISRDIVYSVFPLFSCKQYDVITDQICIIEKRRYL